MKTKRVLIADDNPVNQLVTVMRLKRLGHETQVVSNGKLAIEALAQSDFDLVFMDCEMPVLDGFQAAATIREAEATAPTSRRIPIIGLSMLPDPEIQQKCLDVGMNDFLAKPVDERKFLQLLNRWLRDASL